MKDLGGKLAVITGAGSGIGRATAHALAREGMRLALCDNNAAALTAVTRDLHGKVDLSRVVDVADRDAMRRFAAEVHELRTAVDVLVNNAGVGLQGGIAKTTLDDWDWIVGVNLYGVIHGCHFFVPNMIARNQGGHVVNVASALGYFGAPLLLGYVTTKTAVIGLSESLRAELAPRGIGVSVICPGVVRTGIVGNTRFAGQDEASTRRIRSKVDAFYDRRGHGPEGVADAIVSAIRHDRAVVPVTPSAWALMALKRISPRLATPVGQWLARKLKASG